jgi:hypothetical protein
MKASKEQLYEACLLALGTMEACENPIITDMRGSHASRQDVASRKRKPVAFVGKSHCTMRDYPVSAVCYPTEPGGVHYVKGHGQALKPRNTRKGGK